MTVDMLEINQRNGLNQLSFAGGGHAVRGQGSEPAGFRGYAQGNRKDPDEL